jgi:hypothetical protein
VLQRFWLACCPHDEEGMVVMGFCGPDLFGHSLVFAVDPSLKIYVSAMCNRNSR